MNAWMIYSKQTQLPAVASDIILCGRAENVDWEAYTQEDVCGMLARGELALKKPHVALLLDQNEHLNRLLTVLGVYVLNRQMIGRNDPGSAFVALMSSGVPIPPFFLLPAGVQEDFVAQLPVSYPCYVAWGDRVGIAVDGKTLCHIASGAGHCVCYAKQAGERSQCFVVGQTLIGGRDEHFNQAVFRAAGALRAECAALSFVHTPTGFVFDQISLWEREALAPAQKQTLAEALNLYVKEIQKP